MGYPPNQPPYGQQQPQHGQQGVPYGAGQPMPPQQPYPPQPPPQAAAPMRVQQVGRTVTKPAWTVGDILWLIFTAGLAYPWIWNKRRKKTTITRHGL